MEFYGLVGEKLSHSLSPEINTKIFKAIGTEAAYKLFEISKNDIPKLGDAIKILNIKGCNVTIPYKQEVMKQLDSISDEAEKIGAVNTILNKDGKLYGYNSDYYGFGKMLSVNNIDAENKVAVVLGNGGAAKAVVTCLLDQKVKKLYLVTRDKSRNKGVNKDAELIDYNDLKSIKGDIIVNTTPVGMFPKTGVSPVSEEIIKNFDTLVDIVYNPKNTEFLNIGQRLNKKVCGGLYMLVGQAIKSEEIWNDTIIDDKVLNDIYKELENTFN